MHSGSISANVFFYSLFFLFLFLHLFTIHDTATYLNEFVLLLFLYLRQLITYNILLFLDGHRGLAKT